MLFSDLSIGQMLAVFSYLWFMIGPVEQLLNLQYAYYAAGGAMIRINELLSRADEPQYPAGVDPFQGRETVGIEVRGLSFGYGAELVLDQMDLSIAPALEIAQLDATVKALPQGLDSIVGRSGVSFSGGQRQRLANARMVLAEPKVVILDKATSALDVATEYNLRQALARFLNRRTTLIIAYRLSAVNRPIGCWCSMVGR